DRHSIWPAVGYPDWRESKRTTGLFFAATWTRSPLVAARVESSGEHLRAAFAQRALDHFGYGRWQSAGKICAARCSVAIAVLRSHQLARGPYIFWRRDRSACLIRRADQRWAAEFVSRIGAKFANQRS